MKFIGVTQSGEPFAQAVSDEFDVVVGSAYQLVFHTFMGTAFGGIPISPNPVVAVADRGGNAIASLNSGQVAAVLTRTPTTVGNGSSVDTNITALEQLRPAENTVVDIVDGLAAFEGLYINKSGYPYQITFESSLVS